MDLKKLSDKDLKDIINNSNDVAVIAAAEDELVDRLPDYDTAVDNDDEATIREVMKSWRAR